MLSAFAGAADDPRFPAEDHAAYRAARAALSLGRGDLLKHALARLSAAGRRVLGAAVADAHRADRGTGRLAAQALVRAAAEPGLPGPTSPRSSRRRGRCGPAC